MRKVIVAIVKDAEHYTVRGVLRDAETNEFVAKVEWMRARGSEDVARRDALVLAAEMKLEVVLDAQEGE